MLTCREATTLMSRSMDAPLRYSQRFSLWMHLSMCRFCRRYQRQLRFLRIATRWLEEAPVDQGSPGLSDDAKARMAETLKDAWEKDSRKEGSFT